MSPATSNSIDPNSRTLLTEVDIDNRDGELFPGAYVTVHMAIPGTGTGGAVKVPANTLIFRSHGLQVAVLGDDGKAHLKSVEIGRDFGNAVELISGVTANDQVVINPPDSLEDGQAAKVAPEPSAGATEAQGGQGKKSDNSNSSSGDKKSGSLEEQKNKSPNTSTSPGAAQEKQSTAPGKSSDQTKGGSQPPTGMTAPGSDGTTSK